MNLDDDALIDRVASSGVEPGLAAKLVVFLPMAYGRLILEKSGAHFPDFYLQESSRGDLIQHSLSSEPAWNASIEFANAEIAKGISLDEFWQIAARSAEVDAANQALNAGYALKDSVFSPCTLPLPLPEAPQAE